MFIYSPLTSVLSEVPKSSLWGSYKSYYFTRFGKDLSGTYVKKYFREAWHIWWYGLWLFNRTGSLYQGRITFFPMILVFPSCFLFIIPAMNTSLLGVSLDFRLEATIMMLTTRELTWKMLDKMNFKMQEIVIEHTY